MECMSIKARMRRMIDIACVGQGGGRLTAPVSSGDPRRLELELKEQVQGLTPVCARRMWLGSVDSDIRAREATSPAMAAHSLVFRCNTAKADSALTPVPWQMFTCARSAAN